MTDLGVVLAVSTGMLALVLAAVIGEALVRRLGDRRFAMRVAKEFFGPISVERPVTPSSA